MVKKKWKQGLKIKLIMLSLEDFKILMAGVAIGGAILLIRLFMTQIGQKDYYATKLSQYNTSIFTSDTFRGNIYDRNYNRLVYNKNINCATYYAVKNIQPEEIERLLLIF
ncbi:MAG: hypothetical protein ACLSBH_07920 [Coprobacillus cateniformis]